MAAAERVSHARRTAQARRCGKEQGPRRGEARPTAHRCDQAARRTGRGSRRRHRAAGGAGERARSDTERGDRTQPPLAGAEHGRRRGTPRALRDRAPGHSGPVRARAKRAAAANAVRTQAGAWIEGLGTTAPAAADALIAMRSELAALRDEAGACNDDAALARLAQAESRIARWERGTAGAAGTLALVLEAEQLAAGTSIDHAELPARWQALDRSIRTPELTRRFEAAMTTVEQRRLAQIQATQQEANAARQQLHALLHGRSRRWPRARCRRRARPPTKSRRSSPAAGQLPKPSTQRLGRLVQQLVEIERWESFGQQNARVRLCERAEAAATQTPGPAATRAGGAEAAQRMESARPAARGRAQGAVGALRRRLRKGLRPRGHDIFPSSRRRERKRASGARNSSRRRRRTPRPCSPSPPIGARSSAGCAKPTRAGAKAILGSVDPGAWKKLDPRFKSALAPLREALSAARDRAKAGRQALIDEVDGAGSQSDGARRCRRRSRRSRRDGRPRPRNFPLAQRDERALWKQFRAACDAVFDARQSKRKEEDGRRNEHRRALAGAVRAARAVGARRGQGRSGIAPPAARSAGAMEAEGRRIRSRVARARIPLCQGKAAVEATLSARARSREAAVWQTLAAKERLCEELDGCCARAASAGRNCRRRRRQCGNDGRPCPRCRPRGKKKCWRGGMPRCWRCPMPKRRENTWRAWSRAPQRGGRPAELELSAGPGEPARASAATPGAAGETAEGALQRRGRRRRRDRGRALLAWCAQPGVADALDRQRCERILARIEQAR